MKCDVCGNTPAMICGRQDCPLFPERQFDLKEVVGHAKMCVRMKLRKDERDFSRRGEKVTVEQAANHMARIERGKRVMGWLKELEKTDAKRNLLHP